MNRLISYFAKIGVFADLLTILVIVVGIISAILIKREVFPNINYDLVSINTTYPGSTAKETEKLITNPIEQELKEVDGISLIKQSEKIKSPYYKYIVYLDDKYERDKIKTKLKNDFKVSLPGEVYSQLCHSQPVFNKYKELILNDPKDQFPGAEYVSNQQICLPLYPDLRVDELMYVVDSLKSVLDSLN